MSTKPLTSAAFVIAVLETMRIAQAQEPPRSGIYQIQSGSYYEWGGFTGVTPYDLPYAGQAFVSLNIDPGGSVQLSILGKNQQTVFRHFTNGVVASNTIRFQEPATYPYPIPPNVTAFADYLVTNAAGHLWINGAIIATVPCCDIPSKFEHTNVTATFMPHLTVSVTNGIELRWTSASNQNYQVQSAADPGSTTWTNVGGLQNGNGSVNSATDAVPQAPAQKFYRVLTTP